MEGLPYEEKNKYENIILAGLLFTSKTPTERLLTEFFARLKNELISLKENGIPVIEKNSSPIRTWVCVPELKNGIIDFGALKTLYNLPRWQSLQGCHLCTFPGRRAGRRVIWFNRFPNISDRRTEESLIIDADMRQNGLRGFTQMMDLFMVNRCMPDALHLLSEGITTTIFKAMFDSRRNASIMAVQKQCIGVLNTALVKTRNYTYSSKFILALSDMSRCTGSEKDALSFLAFPLAAALNMFVEPVGAVAVLAYWILVRVLEKTKEITSADFPGIRDLANSMKFLWYDLDPTLFTLKVHCFIDHALLEDLPFAGSPYNWSSNSFESVHRRLQLRVAQCTTNVEEKLINNFLFHKDIVDLLGKEVQSCENVQLDRLHRKITEGTTYRTERRVASISLKTGWSVPVAYKIEMDEVTEEHKNLLRALMPDECRSLAARVCHDGKIYSSAFYRRRDRDTIQSCVYLETPDGDALYGIVIAFVYDTCSSSFSLSQPASSPLSRSVMSSPSREQLSRIDRESGVEKSTPVVRVRQSENVDFRGVARNLVKGNEIAPKLLGEALGHFDDTSEVYHELMSGQVWECSVNMREVKQLQSECVQLPKSSDAVVTRLMEFVNKQTHTIVGMAAMVSR
ncbi:hypothetical protein Q1695_005456 [Nippostrongylus brasiliensis]|nr:hypothetical protein Q1695_005456 [Nippostrongylus brasiliensis]